MENIENSFTHALVREPGRSLIHGLTTSRLGAPDPAMARLQHQVYVKSLEQCGLKIMRLAAQESFPDGVFVEDTAVIAPPAAIITRPGAPSRRGEEKGIQAALAACFTQIEKILPPGTLEGGDVMRVKNHFYVGISKRTNREGFEQFHQIVATLGYHATAIPLKHFLHLKTGISYLGNNRLLTAGELIGHPHFSTFKPIAVASEESYAANSIRINDFVLLPAGFPKTERAISGAGFKPLAVDVSEFQKLDGGVSCLSIRF